MATLKNQNGTNNNDLLTYDKGGSGVVYHTGAGADKVSILADAISLVNDSGSATITVTGGAGHNIAGTGSSVETITLNGGNALEAQLGSGKDVVIITNSNGRKSTGGSSAIRGGEWTDTFTTEEGAQNYQLYGDAGNDVFNVNGGKNMNFWGGAANDTFIVKGGTNNKLYGGDSADVFEIYAAKQNMILSYGNDTVNINAGDEQQIKANLGINTINLLAGARHVITADIDQVASKKAGKDVGYGVDKLFLNGATYVTANLGDGKDEVNVSRGYGHKIYTEGWGDTINISGTASNNLFDAGDGDDIINISGGNNNTVVGGSGNDIINIKAGQVDSISAGSGDDTITVTGGAVGSINGGGGNDTISVIGVDCLTMAGGAGSDTYTFTELKAGQKYIINNADFAEGDADRLVLDKYNKDDFEYALEDGIAVITHKATGATITINGWEDNAIAKVAFLDGEVTGQSLFTTKTLVIDDGKTYGNVGFLELDPYEKKPGSDYSVILKDGIVDTITGRYLKQGDVENNAVVVEGGTVRGDVIGAESDNGNAIDNTVDIKGGYFVSSGLLPNTVVGGLSRAGSADNNTTNIATAEETNLGLVWGGYSGAGAPEGTANNNMVMLSGNVYANTIAGGLSTNNSANGNVVILDKDARAYEAGGGAGATEASNNKLTVKGQAEAGTVMGGNLKKAVEGKVEKNEVIIAENAYVKVAKAGYGYNCTGLVVQGNMVKISDNAMVEGIICAESNQSTDSVVANNQVIVEGGTINNSIRGGLNQDGKALNNSVILSGKAIVVGDVIASDGAFNTETDIMGSVTVNDQAEVKGRISGDVGIDTITINGGTVKEINTRAGADIIEINGGTVTKLYSDEGDDTIHVTGGSLGLLDGGLGDDIITVTGGSVGTVDGSYGNDTFNLSGVETLTAKGGSGSDTYSFTELKAGQSYIIDNSGNQDGDADSLDLLDYKFNEFTIAMDNGNLVITHKATNATITINDYDNNLLGEAKFQDITLTGQQLKNLDKIMIINDGAYHPQFIFQLVDSGDTDGYEVILSNGEVYGITSVWTEEGTASNNKVTVTGGKVTSQLYAARGNGSDFHGTVTDVYNNSVTITGGTLERNIYAGFTSNGEASGNSITITGGTIEEDVYAGFSYNGKATNNTVTITGDTIVKGDIHGSFSYSNRSTDEMGSITVGSNVTIGGIVYGDLGKDVITIDGCNFTNTSGDAVICGLGGADTIRIIKAGTISGIDAGSGSDTVIVNDGIIGEILLGIGNDSFVLEGADAKVDKLDLGAGENTITLISGSVGNIKFGDSGDTINLKGVSNMELLTGEGADHINIFSGSNLKVQGNNGKDVFEVSGGDHITLEGGDGNDVFNILGGDKVTIIGGAGDDTYKIYQLDQNYSYVIDFGQVSASEKEVVDISDYDKEAFEITKNGKEVILTYEKGATLTLKDWDSESQVVVKFKNGEIFNYEQLTESVMAVAANSQADILKSFMSVLNFSSNTGYAAAGFADTGALETVSDFDWMSAEDKLKITGNC